jgi:hypothetical protein
MTATKMVNAMLANLMILLVGLTPMAVGEETPTQPATPAEQNAAIAKEFNSEGFALRQAKTDEERLQIADRVKKLSLRSLNLAEKNPKDPVAMDALVQAVNMELWMESNTSHPGWGPKSPGVQAIAILLRDFVQSDKAAEACRRLSYGFRKECEVFLRAVSEMNPSRDVRGLASLRLAQSLNMRLQRLELLKERPELAKRYEGLFGQDYLDALRKQDRAQAMKEIEAVFEHAAQQYGDVIIPYGDTVGKKANSELYEIRHLTIGRTVPDIEGDDQDGKRFKLSDYRGKVVLLYFWSEY